MQIRNILNETINSKYRRDAPYANDLSLQYVDYLMPYGLTESIEYSEEDIHVLSPNTENFIKGTIKVPFKDFADLAKNKYNINWNKISDKNHKIQVVGYGGFMSNMFYFISELAKENTRESYRCIEVSIYENDKFSTMNGVRTFQDISKVEDFRNNNKIGLFESIREEGTFRVQRLREEYFTVDDIDNRRLIIGSPDFDTRILLQDENFLFFGNSNSDFVIHKTPVIDNNMARETYGKLNVVEFWVGILEATYEFLYMLENYSDREIRNFPDNTELYSKNTHNTDINRHKLLNREPIEESGSISRRQYNEEWSTF